MLPQEFYNLAGRLLTNEPNAEGFRSSVSRAYYAAFHSGVKFIRDLGVIIPRANKATMHTAVCAILSNTSDSALDQIGVKLGDLRDHRNAADYDLNEPEPETQSFARLRHKDAGDVIAFLNTYRTSTDAVKVAARGELAKRANKYFHGTETGI